MPVTKPDKSKKRWQVRILARYCKSCGLCVASCAKQGLQISEQLNEQGFQVVEHKEGTECTGCGNCALMCPDAAIEIVELDEQDEVVE